jgi:hypothetical protein
MVDTHHLRLEYFAYGCDIAEGEVAVLQLVLLYFVVNDIVHQPVD